MYQFNPVLAGRDAYKFPSSLTLTDDVALEDVMADIPFISVGLLAFGVFTFFFVMRRISMVTIYIHLAAFLAFIAAILDLAQILHRGTYNTQHNLALSTVQSFIVAREIALSSSIGARFLFFWQFVAEPPRGELPPLPIPDSRRLNFLTIDSEATAHSGSWARYGLLGFLLKWGLLLVSIAIPILQIIWRLVAAITRFGPVYNVEGTLEIVVSALFMLKIVANTWLSPLTPRWITIRDYSPPLLGLAISLGLGVGNILCFEFSESSLGRFLQAVEMYILILFVLISAFYKIPVRASVVQGLVQRRLESSPFRELPENSLGSSFRISSPRISTPALVVGGGPTALNERIRPGLTSRMSTTSKISSWLMGRRMSQKLGGRRDQVRLWNQEEAELGQSQSPMEQKSTRGSSFDKTPMEPREMANWRDPVFSTVLATDRSRPNSELEVPRVPSPMVVQSSIDIRPMSNTTVDTSSQFVTRRGTLPSYYQPTDAKQSLSLVIPSRDIVRDSAASPIFGLNGIIRQLQPQDPSNSKEPAQTSSARSSGMESLLRQQNDLDRSIAGLRLFSPEVRESRSLEPPASRGGSGSMRSDFSLSIFPDPPLFPKSRRGSQQSVKTKGSGGNFVADDLQFELVPPRMPAATAESSIRQPLPSMTRDSLDSDMGARVQRLDSQGTQYDVTSFIGNLTTPAEGRRESPMSSISEIAAGSDSDASETVIGVRRQTSINVSRALLVDSRSPPKTEILSAVESGAQATTGISESSELPIARPSSRWSPDPPPTRSTRLNSPLLRVGLGIGGGGLPPRPRLPISQPMRRPSAVMDDGDAFVRPRPAPLALQEGGSQVPPTSGGEYF